MTFDGFISYSHAADGRLAPAVQRGLHRLAKPWHRRRALWIFRDQTGLAVTPGLWSSIQTALDGSQHFVLLASPEAAASTWVNREIEHWVATKSPDRILPVVTDGEWRWDPALRDFAADSTAVPAALRGVFAEEPLFLDLRWARDDLHLSLQHARFRDAIAQLAAPMHGVSKDELEGEDVRQHRRARRLWSVVAGALMLLTFVAVLTSALAVRNADRANVAATEARRQAQLVVEQRGSVERSAEEARKQEGLARQHEGRAQKAAAEVQRQEALAREQKTLAARASTEAGREQATARYQRALADKAAAYARGQEALAQRERAAAKRSAEEARRQEERAQEQEERANTAADKARRQEQFAKEQEKRAREAVDEADRQQRTAISQRLITEARATIEDDPGTALRLGLAAERIKPGADTHGALTGLVTSTHFAGQLKGAVDVAYGPKGLVALTTVDGAVSLWDVTDPARPKPLGKPDEAAHKVSLSPDGQTLGLVTGGTAVLWDVRDPAAPHRIGALPGTNVSHVVFSPDGRTVALGGETTSLWDMTGGVPASPLAVLPDLNSTNGLVFGPDGRTLVIPFGGEIWDVSDPAAPAKAATLPDEYEEGVVGRERPVLAALNRNGAIDIWDMSTPAVPSRRNPVIGYPVGTIGRMALDPTGTILAVADRDRNLTLWSVGGPASPFRVHTTPIRKDLSSLEFGPDGRTLVGAAPGVTTVWSTPAAGAPAPVADLTAHPDTVLTMAYRAKGRELITLDKGGMAIIWDTTPAKRGAERARLHLPVGELRQAAVTADGRVLAVVDTTGRVTLFDVTRPRRVVKLGGFTGKGDGLGSMRFSPDGNTLAVSGWETLWLWDISDPRKPTVVGTLTDMDLNWAAVTFSPNGRIVAFPSRATVRLVDVTERSDPTPLAELRSGADRVQAVAFSPDGRTLAAGVETWVGARGRGAVILWGLGDPAGPQRLATPPSPVGFANALAFAPDGRTLGAGVKSAAVMLWDVTNRAAPAPVPAVETTSGSVSTLLFSPDGRTLATHGDEDLGDGAVALWDYSELNAVRADPAAFACTITGRGLNAEEWTHYVPELPYRRSC